jgi:hypothetical protein
MFSKGVGSKEVVCRPARWAGRSGVLEWGSRMGVRAPPKKLFTYFSLSFRRLNARKDIREGRFNVEEEEAGDGGHDGRHFEFIRVGYGFC